VFGPSACVNPIVLASRRQVPLSYVGAFSFGEPVTTGRSTVVPLMVDFRTGEWTRNPALVPYGTVARRDERKITFAVLTSLPAERGPLELRVPKLAAGAYAMFYVDPDETKHPVGFITVK
jgi:hypothetical protein